MSHIRGAQQPSQPHTPRGPQHFNVSTQNQFDSMGLSISPERPPLSPYSQAGSPEPRGPYGNQSHATPAAQFPQQVPPMPPGSPAGNHMQARPPPQLGHAFGAPAAAPRMGQAFGGQAAAQAPPVHQPPNLGAAQPPAAQQQHGAAPPPAQQRPVVPRYDPRFPGLVMPDIPALQDLSRWRLSDKKVSKELKSWDGTTPNYAQWVKRIHGHANLVNPNWRKVLDKVRTAPRKLTWA